MDTYTAPTQPQQNLIAVRDEIRALRRSRVSLTALAVALCEEIDWPHDTGMNMAERVLGQQAPQGIGYVGRMDAFVRRNGQRPALSALLIKFLTTEGLWVKFEAFINAPVKP